MCKLVNKKMHPAHNRVSFLLNFITHKKQLQIFPRSTKNYDILFSILVICFNITKINSFTYHTVAFIGIQFL